MQKPPIRQMYIKSVIIHSSQNLQGGYVHWRLYFQLDTFSGVHSVEFNSQKVSQDGLTALYVEHRSYKVSTKSPTIGQLSISVPPGITVQHVIDLALRNRRDQYRLTTGGSGCRYWCQTFINDLENARYVPGGASRDVELFMQGLNRHFGNQWVPYPLYQGTFY